MRRGGREVPLGGGRSTLSERTCSRRRWVRFQGSGFRFQGSGFRVQGAGFRVQGSGCRVQGSGCRVQDAGCRVQGAGCRVQGSGFRVQGLVFRVQGSGFRVQGSGFKVQGTPLWVSHLSWGWSRGWLTSQEGATYDEALPPWGPSVLLKRHLLFGGKHAGNFSNAGIKKGR